VGSPASAATTTHLCQPDNHYNVESYQLDGFHRGVYVWNTGMWVASQSTVSCFRVSSIALWRGFGDNVELGWIRTGLGDQCGQTGASTTWRLISVEVNYQFYCPEGSPGNQIPSGHLGSDRWFGILNANGDGHFDFWYDHTFIVTNTIDTMWSGGWTLTNGERITCSYPCTSDTAWSKFRGLDYEDSTGLHDWYSAEEYLNTDTGFHTTEIADDWWLVEKN